MINRKQTYGVLFQSFIFPMWVKFFIQKEYIKHKAYIQFLFDFPVFPTDTESGNNKWNNSELWGEMWKNTEREKLLAKS